MITLYSNNCPKFKVLKKKLDDANVKYTVVDDTEIMISKGIDLLPVLEIDNIMMDFATAVEWANNRTGVNKWR